MVVVSNTSPLTNLAAIGQLDLLRPLFGRVEIAEGVWRELNAQARRWPGSLEVEKAGWINRHLVKDQRLVTALRRDLDEGESESIVLALEMKADLVLLDEKEGRRAAHRLGLNVMGVIGVLLLGRERKEIDSIRYYLDALRQTAGFFFDENLYQLILEQAKE